MNPLKPYKEHIVGELAEVARWTVLNVKTGISWPYEVQKVRWRDRDLFILPASEDKGAGVAVKLEKHEVHDDVQKLLLTFLSALCWVERGGPGVVAPTGPQGFGSQLIELSAVRQLGGKVTRDWRPEGLVMTVEIPLTAFSRP